MLDAEFLLEWPPFSGLLVYRYRTGILRNQMRITLDAIANRENRVCFEVDCSELVSILQGLNLFADNTLVVCDWSESKGAKFRSGPEILQLLGRCDVDRVALFVRHSDGLAQDLSGFEFERTCMIVEEPLVRAETLTLVLRYLAARTDLAAATNLFEQPEFCASFKALIEEGPIALPEFMQAFDETVLLQTDPRTNVFAPGLEIRARRERNSVLRPLRRFVDDQEPSRLVDLIQALQTKYRGGSTAVNVVRELYRATERLLASTGPANRNGAQMRGALTDRWVDDRSRIRVIIWTATVLSWQHRLLDSCGDEDGEVRRKPDLLLVTLEQLGQEYLARCRSSHVMDPLFGLWPDLRRATLTPGEMADKVSAARSRILHEFAHFLRAGMDVREEPRWLARLLALIVDAASRDEKDREPCLEDTSA